MYKLLRKSLLTFMLVLVVLPAFGQNFGDYIPQMIQDKEIATKIPSLDSLIRAAVAYSPKVKYYESEHEFRKTEVKATKAYFWDHFFVIGNYGYGIYNTNSDIQQTGVVGSQSLFLSEQSTYNVGIGAKVPFSAVIGRKARVNGAKAEVEKAYQETEFSKQELRKEVMDLYVTLLTEYNKYIVKSNGVESYQTQSLRAEKDFENGNILLSEYVRQQNMLVEAFMELETQKGQVLKSKLGLELMTGLTLTIF